ncbi:hypothetical protein HMSSN139_65590 [Paenibacillus sp. HMSSN-139]|nr:hypothetical protein HMSSN139_65590 [Paenibacillus sp. HMSSN-139]
MIKKTTSVLVPYGGGKELIVQLNSGAWLEDVSKFLKQAQQYTVNLYSQELKQLRESNAIVEHLDGMIYEVKENWYSDKYGVDLKGEGGMDFMGW